MKYRVLGQKETPISALGIGAMSFSDFYGKSAWTNPVQNCVWTHYDFSECST